jgi:hypothetical protein
VVTEGWKETVASRAADCLTEKTWNRVLRGRRREDCKFIANVAKAVLDGKKKLHEIIGSFGGWVTWQIGGNPLARAVAKELTQRIPIPPIDEPARVIARALQMTGILLCLSRGGPLNGCQSFIDLALTETKERVKQIVAVAVGDWTNPNDAMIAAWGARASRPPTTSA